MSNNQKSMMDLMKQVRNSWTINPRTRIRENELKSKKKRRQMEKRLLKDNDER